MGMHTVKIYDINLKIVKLELLGIDEFISNDQDIIFLLKHINFLIGLMIGRIEPSNERRKKFIENIKNNISNDRYEEVFIKFLDWYSSMEKNKDFKNFLNIKRSQLKPFDIKKVPAHVINKVNKPALDLSNIECVKCGEKIAQGRVNFFKETENVIVNTCVKCADNSTQYDEQIPSKYPQPPKGKEICPRCKSPTWVQQRHEDQHYFLACSKFPKCRWATDL